MTPEPNHRGCHYVCKEVLERDGGKAKCCRCEGHICKQDALDALPEDSHDTKAEREMEIATDIARDAVYHLKQMYPETYNTKPKTAMISLKGFITNSVKDALAKYRLEVIYEAAKMCKEKIMSLTYLETPYTITDDYGDCTGAFAEEVVKAIRQLGENQ